MSITTMHRAIPPICEDLDLAISVLHQRVRLCAWKGRISLLMLLLDGPKEVSVLAQGASLDLSAASRHLAALRDESLVVCQRDRNRKIYSLSDRVKVNLVHGRIEMEFRTDLGTAMILALPAECLHRQYRAQAAT